MTIRVLLADDQALIRSGFAALVSSAGDLQVVGRPPTANRPSGWRGSCARTSC
jgi:DNA-binding NarL/FixJ family response regulator